MSIPVMELNDILLSDLLNGFCELRTVPDCAITGLNIDSRRISRGEVFFACLGTQVHGLAYARAAIEAGATAVVYEEDSSAGLWLKKLDAYDPGMFVPVKNLSTKLGEIAARFYGQPTQTMPVIGVTGTDGKTSCTHFIAQAMKNLGHSCGLLGTLGYGFYAELSEASHTTPDAIRIQGFMADLNSRGAKQVVMEVSSHALQQHRVNGVKFNIAVLTNLTRDHLDYHGNIENYGNAKQKLFDFDTLETLIFNIDDEFGLRLAQHYRKSRRVLAYTLGKQAVFESSKTISCANLQLTADGVEFTLISPWGNAEIKSSLLGRFNVSNLLATFASLMASGIGFEHAANCLSTIATVPGRMEVFSGPGSPVVIVDYAHTPKALEQVLLAIAEHGYKKVITVFGCGGDRDQGKRAHMGDIAARLSRHVIVTDDNPRTESPVAIVQAILAGISKARQNNTRVEVEHDRAKAIALAFEYCDSDEAILIAGKGHEDYQLVNQERRWFSDRLLVQKLINEQGKS